MLPSNIVKYFTEFSKRMFRGLIRSFLNAVSTLFGLPVHQITTNLLQGDGGVKDFNIFGVLSVSVKTRQANRKFFLVPPYLFPPKDDIMIMMEEKNESTFRFMGWCYQEDFIKHHEKLDLGYGTTFGIRDHHHRSFDDLLQRYHGRNG